MSDTTTDISVKATNEKVITKSEQRKAEQIAKAEQKKAQKILRKAQREAHKNDPQKTEHSCTTNRTCPFETTEQESEERNDLSIEYARIITQQLPTMINLLKKITEPRQMKKIKHGMVTLMVYGIFCFVLQISSRREANNTLTWPQFEANLFALFPDLKTMPHADTLFRLLRDMGDNVQQIEQALIALVGKLIRRKKFRRFLINNCYPIAIDGSRKTTFNCLWSEALLQQRIAGSVEKGDAQYQYYICSKRASACITGWSSR